MARKALFQRVSQEERRSDSQGILQRLLQILDESFDRVEASDEVILTLSSPTTIADRYLQLFGNTLKYKWNTERSYDENRVRIEEAIERYSYKGSTDCIEDLLIEHGALWWRITDMASKLDIWNAQGGWNAEDGIIMGADFYHDGAFLLEVDANLDLDAFRQDFQDVQKDGAVWWFRQQIEPMSGSFGMTGISQIITKMDCSVDDYSGGLYWNTPATSQIQFVEVTV